METLYATSHLAGTFTNPANAVGNTPTTWAGALNTSTNATSRWAIGDPVDPLTSGATQTVVVWSRKGSNSGTPTIALNLYENGTLIRQIGTTSNVTSTTGQSVSGTFTSSEVTNRTAVEIEVVMTAAGGSPSVRNSAQIAYIEWTADTTAAATYTASAAQTLPTLTQSAAGTATAPTSTGTASQTLPMVTQSGDGSATPPVYSGSSSQILPGFSQSATGSHVPPTATGSAAQSLPGLMQAATGTVGAPSADGAVAQTLPALTQSATGTVQAPGATGTSAQTLPGVSQSAAGEVFAPVYSGELVQILPGFSQSAAGWSSGAAGVTGSAAQTLPSFDQYAAGTFTAPVYAGTAAQTLPFLTQSAYDDVPPELYVMTVRRSGAITRGVHGNQTPAASTRGHSHNADARTYEEH